MSEHVQQSPFARALASSLRQRASAVSSPFARALASSLQHRAAAERLPHAETRPGTETPAPGGVSSRVARLLRGSWSRLTVSVDARRTAHRERRLRVVESVSLGEKRFVAIVSVQQAQFLIGHGPGGVSLLAQLDREGITQSAGPEMARESANAGKRNVREAW